MRQDTNPFLAGLLARCPACGKGSLFSGYLKFADHCEACGEDFSKADAGDGPAVFVILVAGAILVPLVLVVELSLTPPLWLHAVLWPPLSTALILALLRPFKATLFALQHHNDAQEARLDE
jgi:uncharacterized protein (DUF983 family)